MKTLSLCSLVDEQSTISFVLIDARYCCRNCPGLGDGDESTNLWDFLNDNSDSEYIKSGTNNTTAEFHIDDVGDPLVGTGHTVRFRMQGSGSASPERCQVKLFDGASSVASSTLVHCNVNVRFYFRCRL